MSRESRYAAKKKGGQMYGPMKKTPPFPDFKPGNFHIFCECIRHRSNPLLYNECERLKAVEKLIRARQKHKEESLDMEYLLIDAG